MTLHFHAEDPQLADFFEVEFGEKFRAELEDLLSSFEHRMRDVASRRQFFIADPAKTPGSLPQLATPTIVLGTPPEPQIISEAVPTVEVTNDNLETAKPTKRAAAAKK